jgi:formate dehydrogenase subunit gamma
MAALQTIERFDRTERGLHWTHSAAFFALLITGVFLYFPALGDLAARVHLAHLTVLNLHVLSGAFYIGGPLLFWLLGNRASLRRDLHALDVWDDDDLRFLATPAAILTEGDDRPPAGRFNAGQKVNTILLGAAAIGFGVTGLILWQASHLPAWAAPFVQGSVNLHDILALATTALVAGHIYLAAIHPTTRPGLNGIFGGRVSRAWARHHHPKWVAEEEAEDADGS